MEVISKHRELKEALESAVNSVSEDLKVDLVSKGYWEVQVDDKGAITVVPPVIEVRTKISKTKAPVCEVQEIGPDLMEINWINPLTRQNGDLMTYEEISHHELVVETPNDWFSVTIPKRHTSYRFVCTEKGSHKIKMRTVDTEGLVSDWSPEVTKEVE